MSKFFTTKKVLDNVTLIGGLGGEQCYLVEGTERALLIDTLTGVGSLKAFVREMTDLPVTVAVTHGHIDHWPGALEYGECFIHPDDIALMYTEHHSSCEARLNFANNNQMRAPGAEADSFKADPSDVLPPHAIKTYPIYDGDVFDLGGGHELTVIHVPGHTYGTTVLLYKKERMVFSGDACNLNTLLSLEGSTSIEEYREALLHFKTFQGEFDCLWGGHGPMSVPASIIDDALMVCDQILAGTDDAIEQEVMGRTAYLAKARGANYMPLYGGFCNIVYAKDMVHKREHPVIRGRANTYR